MHKSPPPHDQKYDCLTWNVSWIVLAGAKNNWTDQNLSIIREQRLMKHFTAIEFKQKRIISFCSLNHFVSKWYLTLNAQINLWLPNRLVNINHLNFPPQFFCLFFAPSEIRVVLLRVGRTVVRTKQFCLWLGFASYLQTPFQSSLQDASRNQLGLFVSYLHPLFSSLELVFVIAVGWCII